MGRERPWRWNLPLGIADPYFLCELALELGMTLRDLGDRASNYEVCVTWPAFFAERARLHQIEQAQQQNQATMQRRSL